MDYISLKMTDLPSDPRDLDREQMASDARKVCSTLLKDVDLNAHKGDRGHVAIVAGSKGMMGANILALKGALRSGCGKITSFVHDDFFGLIHGTCPEVLIESASDFKLNINKFDAIGIGPGLGISSDAENQLMAALESNSPMVMDADAINLIAKHKNLMTSIPAGTLLTPHVGEWERLFSKKSNWKSRIEDSANTCIRLNINILIKGYYSALVTSSGHIHINGTGNHGMAKGGSGDVLTGLISGLLAQGYPPASAAIIGMYIHGLAGDLAAQAIGHDAMLPSDTIRFLSDAFKSLRKSTLNT